MAGDAGDPPFGVEGAARDVVDQSARVRRTQRRPITGDKAADRTTDDVCHLIYRPDPTAGVGLQRFGHI